MRGFLTALVGIAFLSAEPSHALANLLINGDLELPSAAPLGTAPFLIVSAPTADDTTMPGWSLLGNVDVVPDTYWEVALGSYSIDMLGSPGEGTVQQTVDGLAVGATYSVTFDLAINPSNYRGESITTKRLQLTVTDPSSSILATQLYQGTAGAATRAAMNYTSHTLLFVADNATETITFAGLVPLNLPSGETGADAAVGPVIDNVDMEFFSGSPQTPEPASLSVLGGGALLLVRRRGGRGR